MNKKTVKIEGKTIQRENSYWIQPTRSKGLHQNIPKKLCENVKIDSNSFQCDLPEWFIDKAKLNQSVIK